MTRDAQQGLLERRPELRAIESAVERVASGSGAVVLVEAAAGLGKTRLVGAASELAEAAGLRVLAARGAEVERDFAFGVVRQLLEREVRSRQAELAATADGDAARLGLAALDLPTGPQPASPDPAEPSHGVLHGLYWLVVALAEHGPLALVVDDAHWADPPSLRLLGHLARRLDGLPVLLVVATRDGAEAPEALTALRGEDSVVALSPRPLSPAGTGRLLADVAGTVPRERTVEVCHRISGGNPFLIGEVVLALHQSGQEIDDTTVGGLTDTAPESLRHAVMLRVGFLGQHEVSVARAVSVLGPDSDLTTVCRLAGLDRAAGAAAIVRMVSARVLADTNPQEFVHPLVRSAVYADLTVVERSLLHEGAARILTDAGADPARVAAHLLLTEPTGDPEVAERLLASGLDASEKGAAAIAATHLRRALAEPPAPGRAPAVLAALGRVELVTGDVAAAREHLDAARRRLPDVADRIDVAIDLSTAMTAVGDYPGAVAMLDETAAGATGDAALRLDAVRTTLALYVPPLAPEAQRRMLGYATLAGDTPAERIALANAALATAFSTASRADDAHPLALRALADGTLLQESGLGAPWGQSSYVLLFAEDYDRVARECGHAATLARAQGSPLAATSVALGGLQLELMRGDLAAAIAHGEGAVAYWDGPMADTVVERWATAAVGFLVDAVAQTGDLARARELVDAWSARGDLDTPERIFVRYGASVLAEAAGDPVAAHEEAAAFGRISALVGYEDRTAPWRLVAARALLAQGRRDEAVALADEAVAIARRWGTPGGLGNALHARALAEEPAAGAEALEEAVGVLRTSQRRAVLAGALVDLGVLHRRAGRRRDARTVLEEGMDLAARSGARPLAERARSELHVLGARPRRYLASGAESLTATQRRIAELVAEGLTNREIAQAAFITQKTAETHVSAVLRKLDVRRRTEVAAALAEPGA
ncbi:ATP-binding protein [Patulibacter minatonensis]|uniref:ATP-binding protein n=1 Tax=Patulibacter minatonensis TaxID=298163 RepID=UPI00047960FD|nr:LuxR family transcriptional regulator [Patulibacter minatonensis]